MGKEIIRYYGISRRPLYQAAAVLAFLLSILLSFVDSTAVSFQRIVICLLDWGLNPRSVYLAHFNPQL